MNREEKWKIEFQESELFKKAGHDSYSEPVDAQDAYLAARERVQEEIEKRDRLLDDAKDLIKLANYNYHFSKEHIYENEKRSTKKWLKQYEEMRLK